jgi:hypothetical protein
MAEKVKMNAVMEAMVLEAPEVEVEEIVLDTALTVALVVLVETVVCLFDKNEKI